MSIHRHGVVFFDSAFSRAGGRTEGGGGGRGWGVFNINMGTKLNQKRSGSNGENTFQGWQRIPAAPGKRNSSSFYGFTRKYM